MKFLTLPLKKKRKEKEEQKHNITYHKFTNYHFYHLWSDPERNQKNKNWCLILNLDIVTSNKLYFHNLRKRFKFTANKDRELNLGKLGLSI